MTEKSSGEKISVLDHGYVQLVETWGSDERIIEAARMSTDKGFKGWGPITCKKCNGVGSIPHEVRDFEPRPCDTCKETGKVPGDEKLLRYLYEHKHMTPFEMAGLTIEVQAPIFVFREWHRHRVPFGYNELSARYTPMPNLNYRPDVAVIVERMVNASSNKQAQSVDHKTVSATLELWELVEDWLKAVDAAYAGVEQTYQTGLAIGIPKELARVVVPVGRYSRMRATGNLRGWLAFLTLRMDKNAQWEIQQYANVVGDIIAKEFPRTWELFNVKGPTR